MDFTKTFKDYSNTDLLKIIHNPNEYQSQAVDTAKTIFASRELSEEELEVAKAELLIQQEDKEVKGQKINNIENKMKNIGASLLNNVNPIQTETVTAEKLIKIISIVFCGLFIFKFYKEFGMISFMFTDSGAKWDFSMILYFLPFVIIPIATFLFFKRKKIGWTLLAVFLTYSAISSFELFILAINMKSSGVPALDSIFPQTSPITHILALAFWGGILWTISKINIREIYTVDRKYMLLTIGIVGTLTVLTTYGMFI